MLKWKTWREGAVAAIRGDNFSMTPYPPATNTMYSVSTLELNKGWWWASGYWWATKNRVK
jgi:hypothetical protein